MKDYSKPHRGVQFFGVAFEETADAYGIRAAMADLAAAVEACTDDDMRERRNVWDALAYLDAHGGGTPALKAFRRALDVTHPTERRHAATTAYDALSRQLLGIAMVDP